jgi:hypothetical protein
MSPRLAGSSDVKFDEFFPVRGALEDYNDALRDVARLADGFGDYCRGVIVRP